MLLLVWRMRFLKIWAQNLTKKISDFFFGFFFLHFSDVKRHVDQHKVQILRKYCKLVNLEKKMNFHHFEHAANVCKTRGFAHSWQSFLERADKNSKIRPCNHV